MNSYVQKSNDTKEQWTSVPFFFVASQCGISMVFIYHCLFLEYYLLRNGAGYGYYISFTCDNSDSIDKHKLKEPTSENIKGVDIFVFRILQPRVNDPWFTYYFKTLLK